MAKKGKGTSHKTIVEYRGPVSDFVVTWESFFLFPIWGQVLLLPLGALARLSGGSAEIIIFLIACFCFFLKFLADLNLRQIVIDDKHIRIGMLSYPISELRRITRPRTSMNLPGMTLNLDFGVDKTTSTLPINLLNLKADDAERLIDTLARRVNGLEITADVERAIKSLRQEEKPEYQFQNEISLRYEEANYFKDLLKVFSHAFKGWSSSAGPLSTLFLMTPVWLVTSLFLFSLLRDYTQYAGNSQLYDFLISVTNCFNVWWAGVAQAMHFKEFSLSIDQLVYHSKAFNALNKGQPYDLSLTNIPGLIQNDLLVIFFALCNCVSALFSTMYHNFCAQLNDLKTTDLLMIPVWLVYLAAGLKAFMMISGPNCLTVSSKAISLDRFYDIISFSTETIFWDKVAKLSIVGAETSANPDKWKLRIEVKTNNPDVNEILELALSPLSQEDREKLLKVLQEYALAGVMEAEVAETLVRESEKSYTELWLQTLSDDGIRKKLEPLEPNCKLQRGRFEVGRRLGIGGEGTAYEAIDNSLIGEGKVERVVLKETIIPAYLDRQAERETINRLKKESEILSTLESDNIVACKGFFIEDKRSYLILEYIDGDNLRVHVSKSGSVDEKTVLQMALKMCDILSLLHERGIIHRDFTPDNLIYCTDGMLKLIDFAVATEDKGGLTGTIVGKHSYIPPEQFRGHAQTTSDIYAFGATLYHLLTGRDPEPISVASPKSEGIACGEFLNDLIENCTRQDHKKRPQSAAEIKAEIENYLKQVEVENLEKREEADAGHIIHVTETLKTPKKKLKHA